MHFAIFQLALSTLVLGPGDGDSSEAKTYSGRRFQIGQELRLVRTR